MTKQTNSTVSAPAAKNPAPKPQVLKIKLGEAARPRPALPCAVFVY
jgi:hypothetical protein